jgi:hypothetical protein
MECHERHHIIKNNEEKKKIKKKKKRKKREKKKKKKKKRKKFKSINIHLRLPDQLYHQLQFVGVILEFYH